MRRHAPKALWPPALAGSPPRPALAPLSCALPPDATVTQTPEARAPRRRALPPGALVALAALALAPLAACGDDPAPEVAPAEEDNNDINNDINNLPSTNNDQFPTEEPVDVNEAFLQQTCEGYCGQLTLCGQGDGGCIAECLEAIEDPEVQAEAHCAMASECDALERCQGGGFADDRDCRELCARVDGCDAFPSEFFGPDEATCTSTCSGYVHARPDSRQSELGCYYSLARNDCQLDNVGQCQVDLGPDDICAGMCGKLISECRGIPGPVFTTASECLEGCRALDLQKQVIANTCVDTAGCDLFERCFPPVEVINPDCAPFCRALLDKCPGALPPEACPAVCAGIFQALPGSDLPGGAECISQSSECVGDGVFLCILPDYEGCGEICGALEACGAEVQDCPQGCSYLAAVDPGRMDGLRDCAVNSGCAALGQCFQ